MIHSIVHMLWFTLWFTHCNSHTMIHSMIYSIIHMLWSICSFVIGWQQGEIDSQPERRGMFPASWVHIISLNAWVSVHQHKPVVIIDIRHASCGSIAGCWLAECDVGGACCQGEVGAVIYDSCCTQFEESVIWYTMATDNVIDPLAVFLCESHSHSVHYDCGIVVESSPSWC